MTRISIALVLAVGLAGCTPAHMAASVGAQLAIKTTAAIVEEASREDADR